MLFQKQICCSIIKQSSSKTHLGEIPRNIFKTIELQVPKLKCLGATDGTSAYDTAYFTGWNGGERYMHATFYLWKNPRYHPAGEFPREPATPLPYIDMEVLIVLYPSADEAQRQIRKSLSMRQGTFRPAQRYKGGTLYRYCGAIGDVQTLICQSHRFVVEIGCYSQNAEP